MAKAKSKAEVITFKADHALLEAMKGAPNRSDFIRSAVLAALKNMCPLCGGTGILTPNQKKHWNEFSNDHAVAECGHCHEMRISCRRKKKSK